MVERYYGPEQRLHKFPVTDEEMFAARVRIIMEDMERGRTPFTRARVWKLVDGMFCEPTRGSKGVTVAEKECILEAVMNTHMTGG